MTKQLQALQIALLLAAIFFGLVGLFEIILKA